MISDHDRGRSSGSEAGSGSVIRIDRLTKRYGDQLAVDELSLDVPEGAIFGLLGENGAGKTTTIQTLLGLVKPDSGRVEVLGLDPTKSGIEIRRRIGYVPEVPILYDTMTVAQIGWFASGFHPGAGGSTRAYENLYRDLIKSFDLPEDRKISALSKGMRAKVSLTLALAGDPSLLILDEPTSGLDVLVRRDFLESMVDLAGVGRTVLLSSHQIGEVERVASHVALIRKGRLVHSESLDELKARTFLLTVAFDSRNHPEAPPAGLPFELIDAADGPRQTRWLVRAKDRAACETVRSLPGVESLEVEHPGLEEIYIGYMRGRKPDRAASPPPSLAVHVA